MTPTCPPWCKRQHLPSDRAFRTHSICIGKTSRGGKELEVWVFRHDRRQPASGDWKIGGRTVSVGLEDEAGRDTGVDDLSPDQASRLARIVEALGDARLAELLDQAVNTIDGSSSDA